MAWNGLKTVADIQKLLDFCEEFHDTCLKELKYVSGAYTTDKGMHPINDQRILRMLFQGRHDIELEFSELECLHLVPTSSEYTCEIFNCVLCMKNGLVYWADSDSYIPGEDYDGTWVAARNARWRIIDEDV